MAANNDKAVEISSREFEETINNSKGIAIVDFYAEWCLDPKSKLIFNPGIKNIEEIKKGSKVLSFDKNFNKTYAKVKSTHKVISNKRIKIITYRGREIISTPEHLLLTKKGFVRADQLTKRDLIATYLFSEYPEIKKHGRFFLTKENIIKTAIKLGLNKERYIEELGQKGLLEIKYDDEKAHILASLLGLLLADGSLSMQKNNLRSVEFFVNKKDLSEVLKDLELLGYKGKVREQEIKGKINNRGFTQNISRIRISKTSLFLLFATLGGVIGKKFVKGLKTPRWILKGPKEIQKSFLQGFLGGDGPKIEIRTINKSKRESYNKAFINPIEFHFYSNIKNSIKKFSKEISNLLKKFGVGIRKIEIKKEERYKRKDKKDSLLLKIYLNTDLKSAYSYASIGFKYSNNKKLISSLAREYLKERIATLNERKEKRKKAMLMKSKLTPKEISKILDINLSVVYNWLKARKAGNSCDQVSYKDWLKKYIKEKIAYDKVKKIEVEEEKQYPFISISLDNKTKMFVANGIIQHNCMPCLIMSPIIEEMAGKFKEIKFAKINIDDNKEIASKFNIMSIPCLVIFKNGKEAGRIVGSLAPEELEEKISSYLK